MDDLPAQTQQAVPRRLSHEPDWGYLLREIYELYRNAGAGGSDRIRAHQRAVREAISRLIAADPPLRARAPETKPVTNHLKRALDLGRQRHLAPLVHAIDSVKPELSWLWGYDKVPKGLTERFAWAEFTGNTGPVATDEVILGLVLFAPGCVYPSHAHKGISESYYVLSGTVSQNHDGVYAAGSMIFNPPDRLHRITVGQRDPALLLYAWHGPREALGGQKLVFSRPKR